MAEKQEWTWDVVKVIDEREIDGISFQTVAEVNRAAEDPSKTLRFRTGRLSIKKDKDGNIVQQYIVGGMTLTRDNISQQAAYYSAILPKLAALKDKLPVIEKKVAAPKVDPKDEEIAKLRAQLAGLGGNGVAASAKEDPFDLGSLADLAKPSTTTRTASKPSGKPF